MSSYPSDIGPGAFIPTTDIFDIKTVDVKSPEFRELFIRLYQTVNDIANSLNIRDAGYYVQEEFVNGQVYFPNPSLSSTTAQTPTYRQVFRKVINFGALPNATTKSVAHGIATDANFTFTRIYGCASDTSGLVYIPLPYSSPTLTENVKVYADNTNVVVTTGDNKAAYTTTYIVLEYIKQ